MSEIVKAYQRSFVYLLYHLLKTDNRFFFLRINKVLLYRIIAPLPSSPQKKKKKKKEEEEENLGIVSASLKGCSLLLDIKHAR